MVEDVGGGAGLFRKATKRKAKLRLALIGPAGSGKTMSALRIAKGFGGKVALIDSEHESADKYADRFDFVTCPLTSCAPERYIEAIRAAEAMGIDVLIIDSLSHAWAGKDGILAFVDASAKRSQTGNTFGAWREATPKHNALVDAILAARCHVLLTLRSKMEYVQEKNERGQTVIRKVGLQPIQRDGLEYEVDIVGDLTQDNDLIVSKSRLPELAGKVIPKPDEAFGATLRAWLDDGAEAESPRPTNTREILGTSVASEMTVRPSPDVVYHPVVSPALVAPSTPPPAAARPVPAANGGDRAPLSEGLRKKVFACMRRGKHTEDEMRVWLAATYGIASTKAIPAALVEAICKRLEDGAALVVVDGEAGDGGVAHRPA